MSAATAAMPRAQSGWAEVRTGGAREQAVPGAVAHVRPAAAEHARS